MTGVELILWKAIRKRRICGLRFRRQDPIDDYVVDFSCPDARLIVEVDGPWHEGTAESDANRDARLRLLGWRVLRFSAEDVLDDVDWVAGQIAASLDGPPPGFAGTPPLRGGES